MEFSFLNSISITEDGKNNDIIYYIRSYNHIIKDLLKLASYIDGKDFKY